MSYQKVMYDGNAEMKSRYSKMNLSAAESKIYHPYELHKIKHLI